MASASNQTDYYAQANDALAPQPSGITRQPASNRVRNTAISSAVHRQMAQSTQGTQNSTILSVLVMVPQILAVIIVLSKADDPFDCQEPIAVYCIVTACVLFLQLIGTLLVHRNRYRTMLEVNQCTRIFIRLLRPLSTFSFIWFVIGSVWVFNADAEQCNPQVYKLALALVCIHIILLMLPCILLLLLLPFAYCCLPFFMRSIYRSMFPESSNGLQETQLTKLKLVKFRPGMFGPNEEDNTCPITQEVYKNNDEVRVLPCEHHFSKEAIDEWLKQQNSCPMCRQSIEVASSPQSAQASGAAAASSEHVAHSNV